VLAGHMVNGRIPRHDFFQLTLDKSHFPDSNGIDSGRCGTSFRSRAGLDAERGPRMARAETASASVQSDSIKGLAQSIAKPAYLRLLTAEPALRRAVPALIIAFLLTICVGAFVQILDHRRQAVADILTQIDAGADLLAERFEQTRKERNDFDRRIQGEIDRLSPAWLRASGRGVLIANAEGVIVAGVHHVHIPNSDGPSVTAAPIADGTIGRRLLDVLGATQPLTTFGALAGVLEISLPDGTPAFATVRHLDAGQ